MYILFHRGIAILYDCGTLWSVGGVNFYLFVLSVSLPLLITFLCTINFVVVARKHTVVVALHLHLPHYIHACMYACMHVCMYHNTSQRYLNRKVFKNSLLLTKPAFI